MRTPAEATTGTSASAPAAIAAQASASAPGPILPLAELRPGMTGTGRTVFVGGRLETFSVEVLGVLANHAPGSSLIVARLGGGPLAETGVIAGMSGSPVWIDGRLVGAVSSAWPFATAPIAGITPIEEMLALPDRPTGAAGEAPRWLAAPGSALERVAAIERGEWSSPLDRAVGLAAGARGGMALPIALGGFAPAARAHATAALSRLGFETIAAGAVAAGSASAAGDGELAPGSAVAVELVRGDLQVSAVGTVTARDGDRVLAFGHPLFHVGTVRLPLASAEVVTVVPSLMSSFKLANIGRTLGALEQDRASGVAGRIGAHAETVPVRARLRHGGAPDRECRFELASHRLLTPLLVNLALEGLFSSAEKPIGAATVDLQGRIELEGHPAVEVAQFASGDQAAASAARLVAILSQMVLDNEFESARIRAIDLTLSYHEDTRLATLDRVWTDRVRVRPGESVQVKGFVRHARGEEETVSLALRVPEGTPSGPIELAVGDSGAMSRFESRTQRAAPRSLDQLIALLNQLRRPNAVHALLTRADSGVAVRGERHSTLPPSAYALLAQGDGADSVAPLRRVTLAEADAVTRFQVTGMKTVRLTVEGARR